MSIDLNTLTVGAAEMAHTLGITPRRLQQLVAEGTVPRADRGEYHVMNVVHAYLEYLNSGEDRAEKTSTHCTITELRAQEIKLRTERRKERLIEEAQDEGISVVDAWAGGLKTDLMSIPARVTNDLSLRRKIEGEINNAFRVACARIEQDIAKDKEDPTADDQDKQS